MAAIKNKKAHAARKIVSKRLRAFFMSLQEQPTSGVEDLWKRVEAKLSVVAGAHDLLNNRR